MKVAAVKRPFHIIFIPDRIYFRWRETPTTEHLARRRENLEDEATTAQL